jgi:predicted DNA-binding protein with PD1-like motif
MVRPRITPGLLGGRGVWYAYFVRSKLVAESDLGRRYVLVLDRGDELMAEVKAFAERERLRAAEFTGIGAVSSAKLAAFDPDKRGYVDIADPGQTELVSLNGRITLPKDADPANPPAERQLHVHCILSREDGSVIAGHVFELVIRPTCEVFVAESTEHVVRREDPDSGLPVISLD